MEVSPTRNSYGCIGPDFETQGEAQHMIRKGGADQLFWTSSGQVGVVPTPQVLIPFSPSHQQDRQDSMPANRSLIADCVAWKGEADETSHSHIRKPSFQEAIQPRKIPSPQEKNLPLRRSLPPKKRPSPS